MDTNTRHNHNAAMVAKMSPTVRPEINIILDDMEAAGWQPIIDGGVYRSPEEQAEKVRQGVSKVYYSYHNVTDPGGVPASLAADITDARYGWSDKCPKRYAVELAAAARNQGMETGIRFGLNFAQKAILNTALALKNYGANVPIGWDEYHVQPLQSKLSLGAVKNGERPKLSPKPGLFIKRNPILVVNGKVIKAAYYQGNHWYSTIGALAEVTGKSTSYPDLTCPVGAQLTKWGLKYVWNDRIKSLGRFDIRTVTK